MKPSCTRHTPWVSRKCTHLGPQKVGRRRELDAYEIRRRFRKLGDMKLMKTSSLSAIEVGRAQLWSADLGWSGPSLRPKGPDGWRVGVRLSLNGCFGFTETTIHRPYEPGFDSGKPRRAQEAHFDGWILKSLNDVWERGIVWRLKSGGISLFHESCDENCGNLWRSARSSFTRDYSW